MERQTKNNASRKEKADRFVLIELFFGKLLENADAIIFVTDGSGKIDFANTRYREYFSSVGKKSEGENWIDSMVPPENRSDIRKIFDALKERVRIAQFEGPVKCPDGDIRKISWTFMPLTNKDETLFLFIGGEGKDLLEPLAKNDPYDPGSVKKAKEEFIALLFASATSCEPETSKHALRVMRIAELLAKKIELSEDKTDNIRTAALLHDMGKLVVDPGVLFKAGKLKRKEFEHIKKHLSWGADLLRLIYFLKDVVTVMYSHHESYNGRGYPNGTRGETIPIESRVLSIADVYEALTADRPYREAFSREEALAIMEYEKGRKLDPKLTDIFIGMVRDGEVDG
jgi:putative nucleotidyltransferase with HDIG domain/PAS domain S-box-containing protein